MSDKPFTKALADALHVKRGAPGEQERMRFYKEVAKLSHRSASVIASYATDKRTPQPEAMAAMAQVLGIEPTYFREFRLWQVQEIMKADPDVLSVLYPPAIRYARDNLGEVPGA